MEAGRGAFAAHAVRHGREYAHKFRFQHAFAAFRASRAETGQHALAGQPPPHEDDRFSLAAGHAASVMGKAGEVQFQIFVLLRKR